MGELSIGEWGSVEPLKKFWNNKLQVALHQAKKPQRTEGNRASIQQSNVWSQGITAKRRFCRQLLARVSVPAKEANPSLGGFPVAHSTPAAEDDDGDANERRKRGLKRSCGGDRLGTEGGGVVEAGEQERGLTSGGGTRG